VRHGPRTLNSAQLGYALDGFGSGSVLHVGDTTWMGGLMFEL